jgi:peptide/nickel transport system permease protein
MNSIVFRLVTRLGYSAVILAGISVVTFGLMVLSPGDPAEILLRIGHEEPGPEQIASFRRDMGLDKPIVSRYLHWMGNVIQGNMGRSWRTGEPVIRELAARMVATVELALAAFLVLIAVSTVMGTAAFFGRNSLTDSLVRSLSILMMSIPGYWMGFLLLYVFSLHLGWTPVMGRGTVDHLILPAITLGLGTAALHGRLLYSALIEIIRRDHVRFAVAKGLKPATIFLRHVLPGALGTLVTMWAMSFGHFLGGSAVVETVFSWPGIGRLAVEAVSARDVPVVQAVVMIAAFFVVLLNSIGDIIQHSLNPRWEQSEP